MTSPTALILMDGTHLLTHSERTLPPMIRPDGTDIRAAYGAFQVLLRAAPSAAELHVSLTAPTHGEDLLRRLLIAADIPVHDGPDALSALGPVALAAQARGWHVTLVTPHPDAPALIRERLHVQVGETLITTQTLASQGLNAARHLEYRALLTAGLGPKAAAAVLRAYPSLHAAAQAARVGTFAGQAAELCVQVLPTLPTLPDAGTFTPRPRRPSPDLPDLLRGEHLGLLALDAARTFPAPGAHLLTEPGDVWGAAFSGDDDTLTHLSLLGPHGQRAAPHVPSASLFGVSTAPATVDVSALRSAQPGAPLIINAMAAKDLAAHLNRQGVPAVPGHDPLLHAHLLDERVRTPEEACQAWLDRPWPDAADERAQVTAQLTARLPPLTGARAALLEEIERPLSAVLARMQHAGVQVDLPYLRGLRDGARAELSSLEGRIHDLVGPVNLSRTSEVSTLLFQTLGLPVPAGEKPNTRQSTLDSLRGAHPVVALITEHREFSGLISRYLEPLLKLTDARTGRVHTTFTQTVTATGRLSSLNPNLQSIPVRSARGREVRRGFIAAPGHLLIAADYSQIELRLLAHLSGDPALTAAFAAGADIHVRTAALILNEPEAQVTDTQRSAAKTVNFGVLYGMSAHRLARDLDMSPAQAEAFIAAYFAAYPGVTQFMQRTLSRARALGYVETLCGRRRHMPELHARARGAREAAERAAFNTAVQGSAADLMKLAMIRLDRALDRLGARLLLQVHDEVLIEVPRQHAGQAAEVTRTVMETVMPLAVPLTVDLSVGRTWFNL